MRKTKAKKIHPAPDAKFSDALVTRFVNNLMWQGKKNTAFNIFYDAMDRVAKQTGENGYEIWKRALSNITPLWKFEAAVLVVQPSRFLLKFVRTVKYR